MRSVQSRFKRVQKNNPHLSDYSCLVEAVCGQKFTRRKIYEHFKRLVSEDDYCPLETNQLVRYLHRLSKTTDESTFLIENAPQAPQFDENDRCIMLPDYTHSQ